MTNALLYLWLAAATGGNSGSPASKAAPGAPEFPQPPAAPAVKGPPLPSLPDLLLPGDQPAPKPGKAAKNSTAAEGGPDALDEGKTDSGRSGVRAKKSSTGSGSSASSAQGRGVPNLPSLSANALKSELKTSLAGPNEPGQVTERARLEQLAAEIAKAREALQKETTHLEDLIRQRGSCDGELRSAAAAAAAAGPGQNADAQAAAAAEREQMDSVSKAMKGMKPEQAAAVVTRLDHRLASEILRRMRPADAGAVLGFLRPELAAELATEIATRKPSLPMKKAANP